LNNNTKTVAEKIRKNRKKIRESFCFTPIFKPIVLPVRLNHDKVPIVDFSRGYGNCHHLLTDLSTSPTTRTVQLGRFEWLESRRFCRSVTTIVGTGIATFAGENDGGSEPVDKFCPVL
jgi:hypothetical protein